MNLKYFMEIKLLSKDELLFYRSLELRINSKKVILPKKAIEHFHSDSFYKTSPYIILKNSDKLRDGDIVELRVWISEDLLLNLDNDLSKIERFSNKLLSFLKERNIILLFPIFILNEERKPTEKEVEYLTYISFGLFRAIQADLMILPTFTYKKKYPKIPDYYFFFFEKLLENIYSYNNKEAINKRILGYLPKINLNDIKKILSLYVKNEIFNFSLDFYRGTPLSLSPILEAINRFIILLEKETNEISLFHSINVFRGQGREKFGAKDIIVPIHFISSYSYFYTHIGFGKNKDRFFIFDKNTYFYIEKSKEDFEKIIKEEKIFNRNKSYVEKALNTLIINSELTNWKNILDEKGSIKNYLEKKEGLKDSLKIVYKTISNIKTQKIF